MMDLQSIGLMHQFYLQDCSAVIMLSTAEYTNTDSAHQPLDNTDYAFAGHLLIFV